jgi:DNA excision repair protein ERCC-3
VTDGPLIVQSDKTLLLEVDHPQAAEARASIAPFAELERSPEHVHTYRLTPLGLWNARAAGHDAEQVVDALVRFSRYTVPHALLVDVADTMDRYGRLQLAKHPVHGLVLISLDRAVLEEVLRQKKISPMLGDRIDNDTVLVHPSERGRLKQALLKIGWPAEDLAGYVDGEAHPIELDNADWTLRPYQQLAVDSFWAGGSGVVVLPCGAGKTLVGAAAMAKAKATTLILVTNTVSGRQWKRELLARTSLTEEEIGEYSGEKKEIRPVTIATYQVMTTRRKGEYRHLELFDSRDWGLVVYDEVHLLPAPIFRLTADLQSRRRLGGRPGRRRVFTDRPEAVRRALEGHREPGVDRAGGLFGSAGNPDRRRAHVVRDGRAGGQVQAGRDGADQAARHQGDRREAPGRSGAGHRRVPGPVGGDRRIPR